MKKILNTLLVTLILLTLITGCNKNTNIKNDYKLYNHSKTITMFVKFDKQKLKDIKIKREFNTTEEANSAKIEFTTDPLIQFYKDVTQKDNILSATYTVDKKAIYVNKTKEEILEKLNKEGFIEK